MTDNYKGNLPEPSPCGVVGCSEPGEASRCPYDGEFHRHGRVHYSGPPKSSLSFRDGWHLLCAAHLAHVTREREAWEAGAALEARS